MGDIERDPVGCVEKGQHKEFVRAMRTRIAQASSKDELENLKDDLESLLEDIREHKEKFETSDTLLKAFKEFVSEIKTMICAATNRAQVLKV